MLFKQPTTPPIGVVPQKNYETEFTVTSDGAFVDPKSITLTPIYGYGQSTLGSFNIIFNSEFYGIYTIASFDSLNRIKNYSLQKGHLANYLYDKYLPTAFPQFHSRLTTYINQLTGERNIYNLFLTQLTTFVNYDEEFNKIFFQPDDTTVEYQGRKYKVAKTPMVLTKTKEETLRYIIGGYQTRNFQHKLKDVLIAQTPPSTVTNFVKELSHVYERALKYCHSQVETLHFRGSLYLVNSVHYKMESEDKHV